MKLEDCDLRARAIMTPPFERDTPEPEWEEAHDAGSIPAELWDFYRATRHLSASAVAGFGTAEEKIITIYFSRLIRGIKDCLVESASLRREMADLYPRQYNPLRPPAGEVDRSIAPRYRSAFRTLLVNLVGALDVFADAAVVMLPGAVPEVRAGGAEFGHVERWLRSPVQVQSDIVTPSEYFAALLHERLAPIVIVASGPERDWLPLMRMYRNKAAHLGHESYPEIGLIDKLGAAAFFLPRSWPFVPEQYAATGLPPGRGDEVVDFADLLSAWLVHQDEEEYSAGALRKIRGVIGAGFDVLRRAYVQLGRVPAAQQTIQDLDRNRQSFLFEFFEPPV